MNVKNMKAISKNTTVMKSIYNIFEILSEMTIYEEF